MEIGYHGRTLQDGEPFDYFESLTELAEWCDFLIVACPGGAETVNAVNAPILAVLGAQGTLINIGESGVLLELPKGRSFVPVAAILHISLMNDR